MVSTKRSYILKQTCSWKALRSKFKTEQLCKTSEHRCKLKINKITYSKLLCRTTIMLPKLSLQASNFIKKRLQLRCFGDILVSSLLILNIFHTMFLCFCCYIWTCNYRLEKNTSRWDCLTLKRCFWRNFFSASKRG